jgi:PBSX family phage terminase large subunit
MTAPAMSFKQVSSIVESRKVKISLWVGAVSAGKTIASLFGLLVAIRATQGTGLIVIMGKTLQTIERNIIAPLQDPRLFGDLAATVVHTRGSNVAVILGKEVELVGANNVIAEEKIRGSTIELAYVDEATLLPVGFWEMLVSRLRTPNEPKLLATTNPGSTRHWLRLEWILKAAEKNMQVFHFIMDDNPSLTAEYVRDMKASFTGVFYDRMINGLWTNAEGAVYDMWDPTKHVVRWEDLPPMRRTLSVAVDFGTQHATAAVMLGLGYDRKLYLMDELRIDVAVNQVRQAPSQQAKTIKDWIRAPHHPEQLRLEPEWIIVDTAAADFREELKLAGIYSHGARKDVAYGIGVIASLFVQGHLLVSDRCQGVIDEITDYVWDVKATERGEDAPVKRDDDSLDAMRYAIVTTESQWRAELGPARIAA